MISKIYIVNRNRETRFIREYQSTISNQDIFDKVSNEHYSNIIDNIVFKRYKDLYICLVVENENEMYVLGLINKLIERLNVRIPNLNELNFIYQFNEIYDAIDNLIIGGYALPIENQ